MEWPAMHTLMLTNAELETLKMSLRKLLEIEEALDDTHAAQLRDVLAKLLEKELANE